MPFKFAYLARVSLAKGITHAYAPAVVAGQSIGQFHNYPVQKLATKSSHLQNAFSGPSSSGSGAEAKASQGGQGSGGDTALAQYYAAWQHAQQTGDDTDWKQHQVARRIGWKVPEKSATSNKHHQRIESVQLPHILKPAGRGQRGLGLSEHVTIDSQDARQAAAKSEVTKLDEAVTSEPLDLTAGEIQVQNATAATETLFQSELQMTGSETVDSTGSDAVLSPSTNLTSPTIDESFALSHEIVQLGLQQRYNDIPHVFESMVKDGLVPTVEAYNQIILSAISLSKGYQLYPRALEVFGDMRSRSVNANQETYEILISFLTSQSLEAVSMQQSLTQQRLRYGAGNGSFVLPSAQHKYELYSGDTSMQFATKLYNIASGSFPEFSLTKIQFNDLLKAYAKHGSAQNMRQLLADMKTRGVPISLELSTVVIDACASVKDMDTAKACYRDYRDRAIGRTLDPQDVKVYVSLIRAFYASGEAEEGIRFYEKVLQSFEGSADRDALSKQVTDAFVVDGLVQHHLENGDFEQALTSLDMYTLTGTARGEALNKVTTFAADKDRNDIVATAYGLIDAGEAQPDCAMAVSAMYFRAGQVADGAAAWAKVQQGPNAPAADLNFAAMYIISLISAGMVEQGLAHARAMFRQARTALSTSQPTSKRLDEVISVVSQALFGANPALTAQSSVLLFRIMIENGGLVPSVTQDAIARLGPDCVHELNSQDIALALHVQAYMLPGETTMAHDTAQIARFSHLLETVLDRGILMDPSTLSAVSDALPRLNGTRPDLEQRWNDLLRPAKSIPTASQAASPIISQAPFVARPFADTHDPYANTTDHRASRMISDMLESTTGRIETHIADAMSRLRNVRRMGRHLQYSGYAKLITAAGKAKQSNLMHEVLGMAQTDVPFNGQIPAVKAGWVSIYDAMVAACLTTGERQLAAKYHQDILKMGAAPSANTFGIYITTLEGTFDEATEAVKIFQQAVSEGVNPSVFLFNAVIGKLGKARRIDDCLHYFGQMQNLGIRPSSVTYGTLVNALCRTSEESFAVEMFDEMEAAPNYRPRPAPYNSIIQYFLNTKRDRSKVLQYYGRMRSKNIKPTSHTYKLLLEAYATLEPVNLTAAETVFEDMKANGIQPEAVHYGSLIHARGCVLGDMAGARKVFDSVLADANIRPTDNLYQNLLESMVANHQVEQTKDVLVDMSNRGIAMTPYIANTLIHGWAGKSNIKEARAIYDKLGHANREPSTYEAMTRAHLAVEDHIGAQSVVSEMLTKGYPSAVSEKILALISGNIV